MVDHQAHRTVIVGSGAIAAVLAHHLVRAGEAVSFVVRDPGSANARQPRTIVRLRGGPRRAQRAQQRLEVHTVVPPGAREVWLCVPGDAASDPWLHELLRGLTPLTRVVSWLPDPYAAERLGRHLPAGAALDRGLFTALCFADRGFVYWVPGLGAALERSAGGREIARRLRSGGLAARAVPVFDAFAEGLAAGTAVSAAVLELEDWKRDAFRSHEGRSLVVAAYGETTSRRGPGRLMLAAALWALPRLGGRCPPFDLDAYLRTHFLKVGDQTRSLLGDLRQRALDRGAGTRCLDHLTASLAAARPVGAVPRC